ncbi:unnamed protein product [Bemisia tabaci]|uniref:PHD-type domain-containing protein n=1 Tax=Bemisia tabaci TaxID=7038 RepID=A0A9P0AAD7_BEMTA|nr:unnamed protein product [Bemisia tabaci]
MSGLCKVCNAQINTEEVNPRCASCRKYYHTTCAGLKEENWSARSEGYRANWKCRGCASVVNGSKGNNDDSSSLQSVKNIIRSELQSFKQDLTEIKNTQDSLMQKITDLTALVEAKEKRIVELEGRIEALSENAVSKDQQIHDLVVRLVNLEQYSRKNSLEISNVEVSDNFSDVDAVIKLSAKLNVKIGSNDIEVMHRIPTRTRGAIPSILVKFFDRKARDALLSARKSCKNLKNSDIDSDSPDPNRRIYINESMSSYYKQLMWKAKQRAKEKGYEYVWFAGGKLLVRKNGVRGKNGEPLFPATVIITEADLLEKLI